MTFKRLGVFATEEEVAHIKHCQSMPIMGITNPAAPGPGVPATLPFCESPIEAAHRAALDHGLPEIPGYYGIDLSNAEFLEAA